jgi:hypothetical protein
VKRKRPQIRSCSDRAWRPLLIAMNKNQEEVEVSNEALDEVGQCHVNAGYQIPRDLVRERGRKYCTVRREQLFDFVLVHGKACGEQGR